MEFTYQFHDHWTKWVFGTSSPEPRPWCSKDPKPWWVHLHILNYSGTISKQFWLAFLYWCFELPFPFHEAYTENKVGKPLILCLSFLLSVNISLNHHAFYQQLAKSMATFQTEKLIYCASNSSASLKRTIFFKHLLLIASNKVRIRKSTSLVLWKSSIPTTLQNRCRTTLMDCNGMWTSLKTEQAMWKYVQFTRFIWNWWIETQANHSNLSIKTNLTITNQALPASGAYYAKMSKA